MALRESLGNAIGWLLSPLTGVGSFLRQARLLHPEGAVYRARVTTLAGEGPLGEVAARLEGDALARVSSALWRGRKERIDVLGFAVRFRSDAQVSAKPSPEDQDLLFATIRQVWTLPLAPLTTDTHSFLRNDYYAVSPFEVHELGRVRWRLVRPLGGDRARTEDENENEGGDRWSELQRVAERGEAVFQLEVRRAGGLAVWEPVAAIHLMEKVDVDQDALRFSPFRAGRGIHPRGLVHAIRKGTYLASQAARPAHR